jgi:UDP-2,3-diacylglucosamine pyrophosphatase LpxH
MLIVLSDLHFADTSPYSMGINRSNLNLPGRVYRTYFREIAELIKEGQVEHIDLVLAGDIFEITRSVMWHDDHLRPYVHNEEVGEGTPLEKRILDILDSIAKDPKVDDTAKVFQSLEDLFGMPVKIHYIPGNHDRLANATIKIRNKIRGFFGIAESDDYFPNQYLHYRDGDVRVLIRHGHEYDRTNFGANLSHWPEIPTVIDKGYYDMPVLGDIVTMEIASKLPLLFKKQYGEEAILENKSLRRMYQRLIDFDNVRPNGAMVNFLFSTPGINKKEIWQIIEPVFRKILDDIAKNSSLADDILSLGNFKRRSAKAIMSIFKARVWRRGLPLWLFNGLTNPAMQKTVHEADISILNKESFLKDGNTNMRCLVSGHTHNAMVRLLSVEDGIEKYYINSGTFRNVITTTPGQNKFGRLRSKARILIYEEGEQNPEYRRETGWSFDFNARLGFGDDVENSIDSLGD